LLAVSSPLYHFREVIMAVKPSIISGTVRDPSGKPVAEARVYFVDGPVPLPETAALTDSKGSFSLTAPAPGTYKIECNADGFKPERVTVTVKSGEKAHVDIRLRK
jgi:hypothetical protein